ncbi:carboxymuconolactone decarboxylase family protein [Microbacterium sp. Mu-80]|uniref:Carboxymuconolactone decarboxylase family protein n=1 Tax=Microbacterium bandirmense TaxID=3122050 RepID=A0ABU8L9W1_9MICO
MDYSEHLRRLSIDEQQAGSVLDGVQGAGDLDARTSCLVRLAALVAVAAPESSLHREIDRAIGAGADADTIVQVLDTVMPIVGRPRVVTAAPRIATALGDDLDLLSTED